MNNTEIDSPKSKALGGGLPLLCAIFLAIASVVYIMYKSWSNNKAHQEKWKDYEDCGI